MESGFICSQLKKNMQLPAIVNALYHTVILRKLSSILPNKHANIVRYKYCLSTLTMIEL